MNVSAWILVIVIVATSFHIGLTEKSSERFGWVVRLEKRVERMQNIAQDNFKHIGELKKYNGDTPREYDLRLNYLLSKTPNQQSRVTTERPRNKFLTTRLRRIILRYMGKTGEDPGILQVARSYKKLQKNIPMSTPFPCNTSLGRSKVRPNSVHKLRPGDIDVVITLGDSLTSGNGLAGTNEYHSVIENRGLSSMGGGQGTWRQYFTIPNILKLYNPNLYGYSTGDNVYLHNNANTISYNLAVAAAFTDDIQTMFEAAVYKLKRDPKVNFEKDWKMYTIFIGGMDFCHDICYWKRPEEVINHMEFSLDQAITYLMKNSPRTLVNFVLMANAPKLISTITGRSNFCNSFRKIVCTCYYASIFGKVKEKVIWLSEQFLDAQRRLLEDKKYQQKEDFAIAVQPIFANMTVPRIRTSKGITTDFRVLASDCFHLSQAGHAFVTRELWKSMLRPPAQKRLSLNQYFDELNEFVCPTENHPYIATQLNSA